MPTERFVLGRQCSFSVDGFVLKSVRDVGVSRTTTEFDATGYGHSVRSSVVTHRTYQLDVEVLNPEDVEKLRQAEWNDRSVKVSTSGGLSQLSYDFTVHEVSADETLDDAVVARFSLKQWGHGVMA